MAAHGAFPLTACAGAQPRISRALILPGLAVLAAVCACGRSSDTHISRAPIVLRVGIAQPAGDVPTAAAVRQVADLLRYASLVVTAEDGQIEPGLAERWEFSSDGRRLRLVLRPGLVFQDGTPLDAPAAAAVLDELRADPSPNTFPGLLDITSVRATSATEIVVEQRVPSALLLEALTLSWIVGGRDADTFAGPFRVVTQEPGRTVLEAFDRYYRGRPSIDRIELRAYPSPRAAWVALMRDEIDSLFDAPTDAVEFVEASTEVRAFSALRPFTYLLGFNVTHPALRDVRVRRALALAVDRQALLQHAFGGRGLPATGALWPRHWAYDSALEAPRHDLSQARALMQAAGWLTPQLPGVPPTDARLRLSCVLPAGMPVFERLALVLQRQLLDVDVDLVPEVLPVPELVTRLATGRFDTFLFQQGTGRGLNYPYRFWHSPEGGAAWMRSGYTSADVSLDRLRRAATAEDFRTAVHEFQRVLIDDPPAIFLAWNEKSRVVRRRFLVPGGDDRDVFASVAQWRLAAEGDRR